MGVRQFDPLQDMIKTAWRDVTPTRLRLLLVSNCLGAVLFFAITASTLKQHEQAVQSIGKDSAPSVIAAHQIKIGVLAMDADLANELLCSKNSRQKQQYVKDFETWQVAVGKQLVVAAKNITYGLSEQTPVENLQLKFGKYIVLAQAARDLQQFKQSQVQQAQLHVPQSQPRASQSQPHASQSQPQTDKQIVESYRSSFSVLQNGLLPEADRLNKANADVLENSFAREESESSLSSGFVLVFGLALVALLIVTQVYLARRFHRRLNAYFLAATACTLIFVQHLYPSLQANSRNLKIAKDDSYNSIKALLDARAAAYDANAAESRFLLDRDGMTASQKQFDSDINQICCFDPGVDISHTTETVSRQIEEKDKVNIAGFSGALACELANIRFDGEGQAALEMLKALGGFIDADKRMRKFESAGDHQSAVDVGLGYDPDATKFSFMKFDDALSRTLKINTEHFDLAITDARGDLSGVFFSCLAVTILNIISAYFGLRDRMAEYLR